MTRPPAPRRKDLETCFLLVLGALLFGLLPFPGWAKTAVLLSAVLMAPGYAIAAALFLPGQISRELRVVLSPVLSISAFALGGLLVQVVLPLDRLAFIFLLASTTIVACRIALLRRETSPAPAASRRLSLPRPSRAGALTLTLAVAVAGWAIALASKGAHDQLERPHLTSLWMVPRAPQGSARAVKVGVSNHLGGTAAYRLEVKQGINVLEHWRFRLDQDEQWQATLFPPPANSGAERLIGHLYRDGKLERSVDLEIGGLS